MSEVTIYALCEPDNGEVRYIGQTRMALNKRLYAHTKDGYAHAKHEWITSLENRGTKPAIRVLETTDMTHASEVERKHITAYAADGARLMNKLGIPNSLSEKW